MYIAIYTHTHTHSIQLLHAADYRISEYQEAKHASPTRPPPLYRCSMCVLVLTTASLNTRKPSTHHLPDPPLSRLHLSDERLLDHYPTAHTPSSSAPVYRYCTLMP